ncbi:polymorphic toxin type 43 domain-containing protein [Flavobacterium gyeonganense]|uniref:polymorphic toxin type 43 domain-containing protein n=1 Tax=Flavobacterium gyeonganense TaxID=1310418 RepID=UPI00241420DB|nr:polymorphic toxin type 43 domain-containing protein [Flavobacterium gyeonganense]
MDGAEEFHYTLTADKKGKIHLTLTSYKTHNHVTLLWGLIDRYYKIPVKRYLVTHNNTKYYIGFAGTYGNGNQEKSEMFENIRDAQHMWTLSDFKDSFNSEAQSNYQSTVQTVINIQNNTVMYGPINETAWYTPKDRKNKGYGPDPGVIEVSPRVKSVALFKKYNPKNATEFVFDAETQTFVVGKVQNSTAGLSPHQNLAKSIDNNNVVGGLFKRGENGEIITNEMSGHYHQNWTPEIRQKFKTFLESKTGQTVKHSEGPTF